MDSSASKVLSLGRRMSGLFKTVEHRLGKAFERWLGSTAPTQWTVLIPVIAVSIAFVGWRVIGLPNSIVVTAPLGWYLMISAGAYLMFGRHLKSMIWTASAFACGGLLAICHTGGVL